MWCNGIEIDLGQETVLKIGFVNGKPKFDLSLGSDEGNRAWCPWCNNGIRDYDEEQVDCGGMGCSPCHGSNETASLESFLCGDGICEAEESCSCKSDCSKKPELLLPLAIMLVSVPYLIWVFRKGKWKSLHIVVFSVAGLVFAASLISTVCPCNVYCDNATTVLIPLIIASALFVIIFKSGLFRTRLGRFYELVYARLTLNTEEYLHIREIRSLIDKSSEALHHNEKAAKALYACIKPLYKSLTPKGRKRVVKEIRKLHTKIKGLSKKDYLNPRLSDATKKRDDGI